MPRSKKKRTRAQNVNELRKLAIRLCGRDGDEASVVLSQAILDIHATRGADDPGRAALDLMKVSEQLKQASIHFNRQHQIQALRQQQADAKSDRERASIQTAIDRLMPTRASESREAFELQARLDPHHREVLIRQLHSAKTSDERRQIQNRIEELDQRIGGRDATDVIGDQQ